MTERNVTSVIKDNIKEACTSGVLQSNTKQQGFYKRVVCSFDKHIQISLLISEPLQVQDLIPGDIYLKVSIPHSCHNGSHLDFDGYHIVIDNCQKIVCIFQTQADQQERVMQVCQCPTMLTCTLISSFQAVSEVDQRLHVRCTGTFVMRSQARHPNISQLFGICTSPTFLALIMHS